MQLTPYVPGTARGILRQAYKGESSVTILVLTQQEAGEQDIRPAGILVIDDAPLSHPMIRLLTLGTV